MKNSHTQTTKPKKRKFKENAKPNSSPNILVRVQQPPTPVIIRNEQSPAAPSLCDKKKKRYITKDVIQKVCREERKKPKFISKEALRKIFT